MQCPPAQGSNAAVFSIPSGIMNIPRRLLLSCSSATPNRVATTQTAKRSQWNWQQTSSDWCDSSAIMENLEEIGAGNLKPLVKPAVSFFNRHVSSIPSAPSVTPSTHLPFFPKRAACEDMLHQGNLQEVSEAKTGTWVHKHVLWIFGKDLKAWLNVTECKGKTIGEMSCQVSGWDYPTAPRENPWFLKPPLHRSYLGAKNQRHHNDQSRQ